MRYREYVKRASNVCLPVREQAPAAPPTERTVWQVSNYVCYTSLDAVVREFGLNCPVEETKVVPLRR